MNTLPSIEFSNMILRITWGFLAKLDDFIKFNFNNFDLLSHQVLQLVIEVFIWISAHAQLMMIVSHK